MKFLSANWKNLLLANYAPFHQSLEEVNLRFYVVPDHDSAKRAVTFIKEVVPTRVIPLIANTLFHENYVALPMDHGSDEETCWNSWGEGGANRMSARTESTLSLPAPGSIGEFITEHYWGYAKGGHTLEYEVTHPQWECGEVENCEIDGDFAETSGADFDFLNDLEPRNVLFAKGSPVTVSFPSRL